MSQKSNLAHSVKDRLLNIARETGEDFNHLLIRYGLERFLYRLSLSDYEQQFVLKGATLFVHWHGEPHRPTLDADFHGREEIEVEDLEEIVKELCTMDVEPDGLIFDPDTIEGREIREGEVYQGIRIKLKGKLGSARVPIQLDVGFGDSLAPGPDNITYPTLLDFPCPRLSAYEPETTIAEKCQNLIEGGILNSRMKDYYDIWFLSREFEFEGSRLGEAIKETFKRRKTDIPDMLPQGLSEEFVENEMKRAQWKGFVEKLDLTTEQLSLEQVVEEMKQFLLPVLEASAKNEPFKRKWIPGEGWV